MDTPFPGMDKIGQKKKNSLKYFGILFFSDFIRFQKGGNIMINEKEMMERLEYALEEFLSGDQGNEEIIINNFEFPDPYADIMIISLSNGQKFKIKLEKI